MATVEWMFRLCFYHGLDSIHSPVLGMAGPEFYGFARHVANIDELIKWMETCYLANRHRVPYDVLSDAPLVRRGVAARSTGGMARR